MKQSVLRLFALISLLVAASVVSFAQGTASSMSGVVKDPNGAVVVGATVNVKNPGTGQEFSAVTSDNGTFAIPAVAAGKYTVTIGASGFKTAVIKDVEVLAATPASVEVTLQVGAAGETIQVTGAGEVLQTQSANVSNTIVGRQITDLPFASRNALDLVLFLPGTSSPARPRQSTVNGLPKGGLNITLDGINVQDNLLKSSDGFFTYIQPKTDAIDEVTVSSNTPGSESAGEGAVQIKFVTRSGNNAWTGSVYEYLRNPSLNANYYFNNLNGLPRSRVLLNQFGFRLGGPIIKDRAFFFVNYEEYRLPEQTFRTRTILTQSALGGVYTYTGTDNATHTVNLYQIAANAINTTTNAAAPQASTVDPTIGSLLNSIQATTGKGSVQTTGDPNLNTFSFINSGGQTRKFPTVRFDINLTSKQHIENVWNYQQFDNVVDFLNNVDPAFPGFPNHGAQTSNRFSETIALRSTLTQNLINEFRFGLTGGTVRFFGEITPAQFANQGGVSLGIGTAGITSATVSRSPQKRNSPVFQYQDNLNWTKGNHGLQFGFSLTQISLFSVFPSGGIVSAVGLGLDAADPSGATNMFLRSTGTGCQSVAVNFPCASTAQVSQAQNIYSVLTGHVTSVSGTAVLNETTHTYTNNGNFVERDRQREIGSYATDTWRYRPNLTLTGGVRWEVQFPFVPQNDNYAQTTVAELYGPAGQNNIFGTTANAPSVVTKYTAFHAGDSAYNTQWGNIAPSIGIAWSPNMREGWLHKLGGESGQTVIRAGYSLAYVREGTNVVSSILGSNPGGTQSTAVATNLGTITPGTLFRNGTPAILPPPTLAFPIISNFTTSANAFLPDLKTGRVHSWTFGIQRELNRDTVIELRYVGNRGMDMWRQYNLNETNVVENGFLNGEFKLAQANFAANNAFGGARAGSFAYFGPGTGTSPLPVSFAFFQGAGDTSNQALYTSTNWKSTTFTNTLNPALPSALGLAGNLMNNSGRIANALAAGLRPNFFVPNMNVFGGGSFLVDNSNRSYYNGAVVELRRRLSHGLLFQGSYTFSKSMTNYYASSSVVAKNYVTLRNTDLDRSRSPFDINHSLKANFIYEFPIGKGQRFLDSSNSVVDHLVSGWGFNGTVRIQSGTPLGLGNVQLVGMSRQELQDEIAIGHDVVRNLATGAASGTSPVVTFLPLDIRMNTFAAFNGTSFAPTGRYIAPANMNSPIPFSGATGYSNLVLSGPRFTRFDLSFVKKTKITERINFEFRAELLNAFNNIDFRLTAATADVGTLGGFTSSSFGTTTLAYQDTSTTNDPGGRLIQFVARINF